MNDRRVDVHTRVSMAPFHALVVSHFLVSAVLHVLISVTLLVGYLSFFSIP